MHYLGGGIPSKAAAERLCRRGMGEAVAKRFEKQRTLSAFVGWKKNSVYARCALALAFCYSIFFSIYSIALHKSFVSQSDVGKFAQALWTTINRGELLKSNVHVCTANPSGSYFGRHFAPIVLALIPFFALHQSPETLLAIKSFAVGFSALPLYHISQKLLRSERLALSVTALYLLNPSLLSAQLFGFQEQCFLPLFVFLMYLMYLRGSALGFFSFLVLSLSVSEFVPIMLVMFFLGLAVSDYGLRKVFAKELWASQRGRWLLAALLVSVGWLLLTNYVMRLFSPLGMSASISSFLPEEAKDTTPWGIAIALISNPSALLRIASLDVEKKFLGLTLFLAPLLWLPLAEPTFILSSAPYFFLAWMSLLSAYYLVEIHYPFYLISFAFIGFVRALEKHRLQSLVAIALVATVALYSRAWVHYYADRSAIPVFDERVAALEKAISLIPRDGSVLADDDVFSHLATRENAYCLYDQSAFQDMVRCLGGLEVDYVVVDRVNGNAWGGGGCGGRLIPFALDMLRSGRYSLYAWGGGVRVLKKGYVGETIVLANSEHYDFRALLIPKTISTTFDPSSQSSYVIAHERGSGVGTMWFGPYTTLIPGKYVATYRIKVVGEVNKNQHLLDVDVSSGYGTVLYASKQVFGRDVPKSGQWFDVVLEFEVDEMRSDFEFRGFAKSDVSIYLDYILIKRVG